MKIIEDRARYDSLQAELVDSIASAVRGHIRLLLDGRIPADLNEVTSDIVSSIANILDASDGGFERGIPMVTFAITEERREIVVPGGGEGSWMHEYANNAFKGRRAKRARLKGGVGRRRNEHSRKTLPWEV